MRSLAPLFFLLLCAALAGCPSTENPVTDTGAGLDGGVIGTDAPGTDAPGTDAPVVETDAPVAMTDAGGTTSPGCELTGYPTLGSSVFISGLSSPLYMAQPPGSTDFYVVQRDGRIRVADTSGALVGDFLDIRSIIANGMGAPTGNDEQGLLGLAFHPDYATNGLFYVAYTPNTDSFSSGENIVAVGHRSTANPRVADATVTPILTLDDPYWNHNGGCLQFGPDGELYIGTGDGGSGGDPDGNGQDNTQMLAKILRIHVDETTGSSYTIPAGNPFTTPNRPEIWATGVRNPWRFSFDRLTGDFWLGDVGQNQWEEIDVALAGEGAGENYGWSRCEGLRNYNRSGACDLAGSHLPIVVHSHGGDPMADAYSITGGYVYRGTDIPGLNGAYLYGDFGSNFVAALRYCDGAVQDHEVIDSLSGVCAGGLASFAEGGDGELYMVCFGGTVRRITSP